MRKLEESLRDTTGVLCCLFFCFFSFLDTHKLRSRVAELIFVLSWLNSLSNGHTVNACKQDLWCILSVILSLLFGGSVPGLTWSCSLCMMHSLLWCTNAESTNWRIQAFAIAVISVMVVSAVMQLWFYHRYFTEKKIL